MDEIDAKIRDTLLYIKANPECNTNPDCLDGDLIHDLQEKGLLRGSKVANLQSKTPEYICLRLTSAGEEKLQQSKFKINWRFVAATLFIAAVGVATKLLTDITWQTPDPEQTSRSESRAQQTKHTDQKK